MPETATRSRRKVCHWCGQRTLWPGGEGLVRMHDKFLVCPVCKPDHYERCGCGTWWTPDSMRELSGARVCPKCHKARAHKCSSCGDAFDSGIEGQGFRSVGGRWYCDNHRHKFRFCEVHKAWDFRHRLRSYVEDNKTKWLCSFHVGHLHGSVIETDPEMLLPSGKMDFAQCGECHATRLFKDLRVFTSPNARYTGWVCLGHVSVPSLLDCGHVRRREDVPFTVPDTQPEQEMDADGLPLVRRSSYGPTFSPGDIVCPTCWSSSVGQGTGSYIRAHGGNPLLAFHRMGDGPCLGVELEVDNGDNAQECAKRVLLHVGSNHVWCKLDGSLNKGVELVTHPATLEYMLAHKERYGQLLDIPRVMGFTSHDAGTCGLHVHVDRKWFDGDTERARLVWLTEHFWPEMFIFARRSASTAQRTSNWRSCLPPRWPGSS
jgi:hypothetical protein